MQPSSSSSTNGSIFGHLVPTLLSLPSIARPTELSDTEVELNDEELKRIHELSLVSYQKALPPPPIDGPFQAAPKALPPPPVILPAAASPKIVRSPSRIAGLNSLLGSIVNPASIFKIEAKSNGEKRLIYPRPDYASFQDPFVPQPLTAASIKQAEVERELQGRAFEAVKAIILTAKPIEELYAELHSLFMQNRLIPLLPHILPLLPNWRVIDELLSLSCQKTEKDLPFRSETPGITIFCYELKPELDKLLGKRFIGTIAYNVICSSMKLGKYLTTPRGEVLPSPKEKVIEHLYKLFMKSLAERLSEALGARASLITERMGYLLSLLRKQKYGFYSSEKKRHISISPENLLLNFFILRFVNPEVYGGNLMLKDDDDAVNREVANYFRVLTREVQKKTNELIDDNHSLTREQQLILTSIVRL